MAKLKDLLSEVFDETPKVDRHKVSEGVRNFGIVGKSLYNSGNIMEVAKQLAEIAESAHHHILGEQDDWFDKISVNKNMKTLKGSVVEFQKTAKEAHQLNQRLTGLYEDIGHVLNRYYEIDEALDPLGKEDDDVDNDGDSDEADSYLKHKRKAQTKAIKGESVGDSQNMDQVDRPNSPAKDGRDNENEALDRDKTANGGGDEDDLAGRDGDEMKENQHPLRKKFSDIGGVVGIPSLGQFVPNKK
jgi:hypothetical protein